MIQITVNGQDVQIESSMSVQRMLDTVDVPPNYLAVELNGNVVPREQYGSTMIHEFDTVEVVTLVGGG